ncbi:MAG: hypothetical protein M1823_001285 [Watsoniomyces obsoletus]|nr:MAG: hypothetical protein M1823_001285 [Watsoniomyces obsoletus]
MADSAGVIVASMTKALRTLLEEVRRRKDTDDIGMALEAFELDELLDDNMELGVLSLSQQDEKDLPRQALYARIETAVRHVFNTLLATTSIEDPAFVQMWNLLDVVSILSDREQCEPGLIFWLVEELLDSQTIDGCKKVFDYLESRRERITAKHFKQKNLIILRSCNELLRRLSRAENTVFCGRVFIFLFQSFPLGDKSSVNLRGEFHVENRTVFEDLAAKKQLDGSEEKMDVDEKIVEPEVVVKDEAGTAGTNGEVATAEAQPKEAKDVPDEVKTGDLTSKPDQPIDYDELYPIFWSLQDLFSNPPRLFDPTNLENLKIGLEMTLRSFKTLNKDLGGPSSVRAVDEDSRGNKRKRGEGEDVVASSFNPKYLTSRDLFELEISDLAFRRHILVQALIILDFLLSLTPKEKAKLAELNLQNKSVQYQFTLDDDNAKWVTDMKNDIAGYLQQGHEGKFYYRMVDTVLSRDKNWVRWKAESCPPIERPPITAQEWADGKKGAEKACVMRKLRANPLGALDLDFLIERDYEEEMNELKKPERYAVPEIDAFQDAIVEAQEKINNATNEEEKEAAIEEKALHMWRTLRLASTSRLKWFDKLDNDVQDLRPLYQTQRRLSSNLPNGPGGRGTGMSPEGGSAPATDGSLGPSSATAQPMISPEATA